MTPDPETDERQVEAFARLVEARDQPVRVELPEPWDPAWHSGHTGSP